MSPMPMGLVATPKAAGLDLTTGLISTPDSAGVSVTGDIDLRGRCAPNSWASGSEQALIAKFANTGQFSYMVRLNGAGLLVMRFSRDGTEDLGGNSGTAVPFTAGQAGWWRATRVASTGVMVFYTSTDGVTWTQLGTTTPASGNIFDGTDPVLIGESANGGVRQFAGRIHYVEIRNGIAGTVVANPDFSRWGKKTTKLPAAFSDAEANLWTVNATTWSWAA